MRAPLLPEEARAYYARLQTASAPKVSPADAPTANKLDGLDEVERAFIATVEAVFIDPKLAGARQRLRDGEIALSIESGEVTWIDADQVADAIAKDVKVALDDSEKDAVRRLISECSVAASTLERAAARLERSLGSKTTSLSHDAVIGIVCAEWGVIPSQMFSGSRVHHVVQARNAAITLLGKLGVTDDALSRLFALDRSTISCSRKTFASRRANDPACAARFSRASTLIACPATDAPPAEKGPQ